MQRRFLSLLLCFFVFLSLSEFSSISALRFATDACVDRWTEKDYPITFDPDVISGKNMAVNETQMMAADEPYPHTIHIGFMYDFYYFPFIPQIWQGAELARDLLNEMPFWKNRNMTFVLHYGYDYCTDNVAATMGNMENIITQWKPVAFLGPTCSASEKSIGFLGEYHQIPTLSVDATATTLSDKSLYPYFSRLLPPEAPFATAVLGVMNLYGFTHANIVTSNDAFGNDFVNFFSQGAKLANVTVDLVLQYPGNAGTDHPGTISAVMDPLRTSSTRCIILWTFLQDDFLEMVNFIYDQGLTKDYIIILDSEGVQTTAPNLLKAISYKLQGFLSVIIDQTSATHTQAYQNYSQAWLQKYGSLQLIAFGSYFGGPAFFDNMMAYGFAMEKILTDGGDITNGPLLLQTIRNTQFDGLLGRFRLDVNGDPIGFPLSCVTYVSDNSSLGFSNPIVARGTGSSLFQYSTPWTFSGQKAIFPGQTDQTVPQSYIPYVPPQYDISNGGKIVVYAVSAFVGFSIILVALTMLKARGTVLVKASSPPFLFLVLFCLLVLAGGANLYAYIPQQETESYICHLRVWLTTMPLTCILGVFFAKSFRINAIFGAKTLLIQVVTNQRLLFFVCLMMAAQSAMMIGFSAGNLSQARNVLGSGTTKGYRVWECTNETGFNTWVGIQIALYGLVMISAAVIAFKIRNVPTAFNESTHIMNSLFMMLFVMVVLVPLDFLVSDNPQGAVVIQGLGQCIVALFLLAFNFGPKMFYILMGQADDKRLADPSTFMRSKASSHASSHDDTSSRQSGARSGSYGQSKSNEGTELTNSDGNGSSKNAI